METPVVGAKRHGGGVAFAVPETPEATPGPRSAGQLASEVLLYRNPALTYAAALVGAVMLGATWFALRGAHGLTLLTGACTGGGAAAAWVLLGAGKRVHSQAWCSLVVYAWCGSRPLPCMLPSTIYL